MVEENAIRAEISPWEQAMAAVRAARAEAYAGIDAAIEALYLNLSRRSAPACAPSPTSPTSSTATSTAPETLSLRQLLRLAPLIPRGYGDLLRATLTDTPDDPEAEWRALLPILLEAERPEPETATPPRPGRPRRTLDLPPRPHASAASAPAPAGRCTSPAATPPATLLDAVFDEIERLFTPPEPREPRSTSRRRTAAADTSPGRAAPAGAPNSCLESPIAVRLSTSVVTTNLSLRARALSQSTSTFLASTRLRDTVVSPLAMRTASAGVQTACPARGAEPLAGQAR